MREPTVSYTPDPQRYRDMAYRRCGDSGLKLPAISLGCWHNFGDLTPFGTMRDLLFTAFDHGITHIDLANNYGPEPGAAERNCGRLLARYFRAHRDELVISTKGRASTCSPRSTRAWSAWGWTTSTSSTITAPTRTPRWRRRWARWPRPSPLARRCTWA